MDEKENPGKGPSDAPGGGAAVPSRASQVAAAWKEFPAKNHLGRFRYEKSDDSIDISDLVLGSDEATSWIDVYVGGNKKPSFRVCNPPTTLEDPRGTLEVEVETPGGGKRKVKFSEDPVRAVARAVLGVRRGR